MKEESDRNEKSKSNGYPEDFMPVYVMYKINDQKMPSDIASYRSDNKWFWANDDTEVKCEITDWQLMD